MLLDRTLFYLLDRILPDSLLLNKTNLIFKFAQLNFFLIVLVAVLVLKETFSSFPGDSDGKESAFNVGDLGPIPESGRVPGEGNSNPCQYSCLENSMDRGAWRATVHGVAKSWT